MKNGNKDPVDPERKLKYLKGELARRVWGSKKLQDRVYEIEEILAKSKAKDK